MKTNWLKQKGISILILVRSVRATAGTRTAMGSMAPTRFDAVGIHRSSQFLMRNNNTIGFADLVPGFGT